MHCSGYDQAAGGRRHTLNHAHRGYFEEKMGAAEEKIEKVGGSDVRHFGNSAYKLPSWCTLLHPDVGGDMRLKGAFGKGRFSCLVGPASHHVISSYIQVKCSVLLKAVVSTTAFILRN